MGRELATQDDESDSEPCVTILDANWNPSAGPGSQSPEGGCIPTGAGSGSSSGTGTNLVPERRGQSGCSLLHVAQVAYLI